MDFATFFVKGYSHTNDPTTCALLENTIKDLEWSREDYADWYWLPKQTKSLEDALLETHNLLAKKYVEQMSSNYSMGYRDLWNGIDKGAEHYHSDLNEGPNAMFLLYFNSMNENIGGGIGFRHSITKEESGLVYPQKYDIIFGSQQSMWEHRASKMNIVPNDRIVATFGFYIEELQ